MILDIELRGSKRNGTIDTKGTKIQNVCNFELFTITVDKTGEIIDLVYKIND